MKKQLGIAGTAGIAALIVAATVMPAHAVTYGTPTISLSAGYLSGSVGGVPAHLEAATLYMAPVPGGSVPG
ncbi:hypothetical protein ACFWXG_27720, partial [Streptomyces sp. NPDC059072]